MAEKPTDDESQKHTNKLKSQIIELQAALSERDVKIQNLEKEIANLKDLINNAPIGIFQTTSLGKPIKVNRALSNYLGFNSTDEAIRHYKRLGLELYDDPHKREQFIQSLIEQGYVNNFEYKARTFDGRELWFSMNAKIVENLPDGSFIIAGFTSDITEQKKSNLTLKEREAQLRTLINTLPDLIWLKDSNGNYLLCNARFESFFGAREKDIVGKTDYDFVDQKLADFFRQKDRVATERGCPTRNEEEVTFTDDGHLEILETIKTPMYTEDGQLIGVLGIGRDISKRKQNEADLKRRIEFEQLTSTLSSELSAIGHHETDSAINKALASISAITGADRAYVFQFKEESDSIIDNTHEWCADGIEPQIDNLKNIPIDEEIPWFTNQLRERKIIHVPDVDGLPREAIKEQVHFKQQSIKSVLTVPMETANGLIGFLGFDAVRLNHTWTEDEQRVLKLLSETLGHVIDRNLAEKERERLKTKLTETIEMAYLGPWEYDAVCDLFTFNDHFYKMLHTTAEKVGGYTMSSAEYSNQFVHPEERKIVGVEIQKALSGAYDEGPIQLEHRIQYMDGGIGYLSVKYFIVKNEFGKVVKTYGVNQDITERKLTEQKLKDNEEKLIRLKKMESIGLLAGGVAHDLNNVLSGIVSYPELLLLNLPQESELRDPLKTIQSSGNKAMAIVQDLLTVARGVAIEKHSLNLNDVINTYLQSPEYQSLRKFHPLISVETKLDSNLFNINGSNIHISKLVMNLVSNAAEAIEGDGSVSIATTNRYLDEPLKGYEDVKVGEYAILTVSDQGPGIAQEDLKRIFEPFFTKKMMGRSGTGLGLTVVWNVVQDHQGYIDVFSNENGTTFELYFPITRDKKYEEEVYPSIDDYRGNGESVLVVDDESSQREITCKMLKALGYKAQSVHSGEGAIEFLKANRMDIVILDMIMGAGINGRETYERIIKIHPKQKAIITSGFADTEDVKAAQLLGAGQYIKKPLRLSPLGSAIKTELKK